MKVRPDAGNGAAKAEAQESAAVQKLVQQVQEALEHSPG